MSAFAVQDIIRQLDVAVALGPNVTLRLSQGRSSTPRPQIDASNYICRVTQLLSKLYATFSPRFHHTPRPSAPSRVSSLRFVGFDVLSGSWQSMNFIRPLRLSRARVFSADQCCINSKLFLTRKIKK